jgi:PAS domain S-box-containing protein
MTYDLSLQSVAGEFVPKRQVFFLLLGWSLLLLVFCLGLSWFFVQALTAYGEDIERRAIIATASAAAASFDANTIENLKGGTEDSTSAAFVKVREHLQRLRAAIRDSRFCYLMGMRNGEVIFLADAEPTNSPDYSPPGQVYEEATDTLRGVFLTKRPTAEGPAPDRWGNWVSGLAPVVNPQSGEVVAIFGFDVSAKNWETTITRLRWLALSISGFVSASIMLFGLFGFRQHRLAAHVRSAMARQQAIFDGAIDGIITFNPSGSIESLNKSAERMFGYSEAELARRDISTLIQIGSRQDAPFLTRIGATEGALSRGLVRELRARHRDGSIITVDVALSTMDLPTGTHVVAVVRDITGRRRVEQIREDFISTVSHELRTPLTSIAGSLGLLAGGATGPLSDKAARLIGIANSNCQRLVRLINNVLDIGKIEAGEFKMMFEPLDLREIAKRSIESMQSFATNYGVKLVLLDGSSAMVRGDSDRLIQVTTNLLANACKFSPKNTSVRVSVSRSGNLAQFSVKDRGPGVPEEFRSRIFSKFSQAEGDSQAKGGTGLGLVIAREIADLHGGRLWFESKTGEGATFYLDMPLWEQASIKRQEHSRLLLCEDDEDKSAALSAFLAKEGFSIDRVTRADEAVDLASKQSYAVGLIDLNLPGADSISLIRAMRARPETRNLPIILLSAVAGNEKFEGRPVVVVDWFDGPLDPKRLKVALEVCLRRNSEPPTILHLDDDPDLLQVVADTFAEDAAVIPARTLQAARAALTRQHPDLVILDLGLADGSGPDLLPDLTDNMGRAIPVVIYTAQEANRDLVDRVDAVLVKSRTSLNLLAKTVHRLIAERETRNVAA